MSEWLTSELYVQLTEATRQGDLPLRRAIMDRAIATTEGAERAFWLMMRASFRRNLTGLTDDLYWAELEQARALAPDHPYIQESYALAAIIPAARTEAMERLPPMLWASRRLLISAPHRVSLWYCLGEFALRRRRWVAACRFLTVALEHFAQCPPEHLVAQKGFWLYLYAHRAWAAARSANLALAETDMAQVDARLPAGVPGIIPERLIGIARAEVALAHGQTQQARRELQLSAQRAASTKTYKPSPFQVAMCELIAGRIARFQGNEVAFAHFCSRALAIAREHKLALTEAHIEAEMRERTPVK